MALWVFCCVLTFPKRHVGQVVHYSGTSALRVIAMRRDIVHGHVDVLINFPATGRAELAPSPAQNDGPVADDELSVCHDAVPLGA
jgi:hypothetical protein